VLTFFLSFSVSLMGNLDWGPVVGGYLAAVLLAAAYAAIGLFVSSRTDNQIVALISTVLLCGLLYLVGSPGVTDFAGNVMGEVLRAIGAGSRFESIQRGVVDVRDLLYYLSLTGVFLTLNVLSLISKRWSRSEHARPQRFGVTLTSVLLALNLVLANVWVFPLRGLRLDLTAGGEYSLSQTTRDLLSNLQEPLLLRGYFSEKTHPFLAPLVPTIRDVMREYEIASGGKIQLEIVDPSKDPEKEAEAVQVYGIRPTPFQIEDRYEASVINSYFDILISYGDQNATLSFGDLIEVTRGRDGIEVRLRNLEYDLTRSIKKVVYGFQSIDAVLAALGDPAELTLYVTPDTLPEWLADIPETIAKVADDIATESAGKFTYAVVDPTAADSPISPQELYEHYGLRPYAVSPFSNESYYLQLVLQVGDQAQTVYPQGEASEADVRIAIESALKRASTGFLKVVGLWTPPAIPTQGMFGEMQQPLSAWQQVGEFLRQEYEVRAMDLSTGRVPADVDVLIVIAPQNMTDLERFAIDQYLMRGGSVVVASGRTMAPDQFTGSLGVQAVQGGLDDVLTSYGVTIEQALVLDLQNEPFPVPEVVDVGGFPVQQITLIDYPFFVDVRPDGMASDSPIISNLPAVTLNWASPVTVDEEKNADREVTPLLQSTTDSWTQSHTNIQPDFTLYPELGFPVSGEQQSYTLAVSIQGVFESVFKGQPPPSAEGEEGAFQEPLAVIESSPETARLVVIGSAEFLDDKIFELSSSITPDRYLNSLQFMQNAVSWCTEDLDLLSIRSSGTPAHLLLPMTESQQSFWEVANYVVAVLALVAIGVVGNVLRRNEQPMELIDPKTGRKRETVPAEGSTEVEQ